MRMAWLMIGVLVVSMVDAAQFRSSRAETQHLAGQIIKSAGQLPGLPFAVPLDVDNATRYEKDGTGVILIPARGTDRERLKKSKGQTVPLGVMWFFNVAPSTRGFSRIPDSNLYSVVVSKGGKKTRLRGMVLGFRGNKLLIFGKRKKLLMEIQIAEMLLHQRSPIDISASGDKDKGTLSMNLFGAYAVRIPIVVTASK